jgi:hypothetical protein
MAEELIVPNLLLVAKTYAKVTGRSLTAIGKEFYGRGSFFDELESGERTISVDRLIVMMREFREKWPEDQRKKWPLVRTVFMTFSPPSE